MSVSGHVCQPFSLKLQARLSPHPQRCTLPTVWTCVAAESPPCSVVIFRYMSSDHIPTLAGPLTASIATPPFPGLQVALRTCWLLPCRPGCHLARTVVVHSPAPRSSLAVIGLTGLLKLSLSAGYRQHDMASHEADGLWLLRPSSRCPGMALSCMCALSGNVPLTERYTGRSQKQQKKKRIAWRAAAETDARQARRRRPPWPESPG